MKAAAGCPRRQQGQVSLFGVGAVLLILVVTGISLDLWRVVAERQRLVELADAVAAAGANGLDVVAFHDNGAIVLDPATATTLAWETLAAQELPATMVAPPVIVVEPESVTVRLRGRVEFGLLSWFSSGEGVELAVEGRARPLAGSGGR